MAWQMNFNFQLINLPIATYENCQLDIKTEIVLLSIINKDMRHRIILIFPQQLTDSHGR